MCAYFLRGFLASYLPTWTLQALKVPIKAEKGPNMSPAVLYEVGLFLRAAISYCSLRGPFQLQGKQDFAEIDGDHSIQRQFEVSNYANRFILEEAG